MTFLKMAAFSAFLVMTGTMLAQNSDSALEQGFRHPPESAKPRTWWHWTNGNVTESGITKDLEWMKRSGIGGFQLVDVAAGGGQVVEKKINYGTPEWYHAVRHSAEEAKRLGLEMSIFSSPGWSEAGGPWVKPEQAMKRLVWSTTELGGGKQVNITLPEPPSNLGPVLDLKSGKQPKQGFYWDSAVIAYRTPEDEVPMVSQHPQITASGGATDAAALLDGNLNTTMKIVSPKDGGPAWLQFVFDRPFTARAFTLGARGRIPVGKLLASNNGTDFHVVAMLPGPQGYHGAAVRTFAFPAVTAKYFRLELDGEGLKPADVIHGEIVTPAPEYVLSEAMLFSDARVNRWEDKGTFGSLMDVYSVVPTPKAPAAAEISRQSVLDLSSKMDKNGVLHWQAPAGRWTILRMGYALTGATNRPATDAGRGYEVDKLNAADVRSYFNGYIDPIQEHLGSLLGSTLGYMTMDSWEAGMQNWTSDMLEQFRRRRGYDPTPFLPVLAGHVVESASVSDRFLWDFRRTLADMFAEEFYGTMENELQQHGMKSYAEASGVALEIPEDTLLNKSKVDIPMAEFWVKALHPESMYYVDVRGAASAAHVYGKPIVAAESYTGGGYESPYTLKKLADYWFAQGLNRLVFHTSAEQPLDTKPGNTMVGSHINRNMTWAEQAKPLMTYLARTSYLLQQGRPVMDLAYLLPEGAPSTMPFWGAGLKPAPPPGYDYDYLNTDVLLHQTSVSADGRLTLTDGMSYRLLILPPTTQMTPEVVQKLHDLVAAGATILGPRPLHSPSLMGYPESDAKVRRLSYDLWGDMDGVTDIQHKFEKGMVYWGLTPSEVLDRLGVPQDVQSTGSLGIAPVWAHRRVGDKDIYYVSNQADAPRRLRIRFRVSGRDVQIWRPMTGDEEESSYKQADGFTTVPLDLATREAVFVVFGGTAKESSHHISKPEEKDLTTLTGAWKVNFPEHLGAPASITLSKLDSWTESKNDGVKYFSGTATYVKNLSVEKNWLKKGESIWLNLGNVRDLAEVDVNGVKAGIVWAPPYRIDIAKLLRPGVNHLEIKVTNEWTNRLMGDQHLPMGERILSPGSPLRAHGIFGGKPILPESGLLGPVTLTAQD